MDNMFNNVDFGPLKKYLDDDDITDISYSNNGQLWLKSLSRGIYKPETQDVNNSVIEKLAFQCANMMGKTFNMAHPFLDAESAELRLNFVHDSIAKNGIALLMRKTPAKIRLNKDKILSEKYITEKIHDFLITCVGGHCNIIISGETGSGKTEFLKYLASHTKENEKLIMIEDTLELHLDKIYPGRDIISMKTNNIASYSDVLVTCMRQNPKWILLSEVRSAEAVMAVRNCISSGHYILSTIHADKAASIPSRMYSLLESNLDYEQYLKSIHRYVQLGVHIRGYQDKETHKFVREVCEVCEFYVDEENNPKSNVIYKKTATGQVYMKNPTKYLLGYLETQGVTMDPHIIVPSSDEVVEENPTNQVIPNTALNTPTITKPNANTNVAEPKPVIVNQTPVVNKPIVNNDVPLQNKVVNTPQVVQPNTQKVNSTVAPVVNSAAPVNTNNMTANVQNNAKPMTLVSNIVTGNQVPAESNIKREQIQQPVAAENKTPNASLSTGGQNQQNTNIVTENKIEIPVISPFVS